MVNAWLCSSSDRHTFVAMTTSRINASRSYLIALSVSLCNGRDHALGFLIVVVGVKRNVSTWLLSHHQRLTFFLGFLVLTCNGIHRFYTLIANTFKTEFLGIVKTLNNL